ncbi:MAG: PIN domain-containing protein [Verrucomicrobiales bacterium]|nr:PIN domain-containing protein [Verrucomicrobiales bacterium]
MLLDSSVVVAGIGWRGGDGRAVLTLLAARGFVSWTTPAVADEWTRAVSFVAARERRWQNPNWVAWLDWLCRASRWGEDAEPAPIVRRDLKDNPIISAAISCRCQFLVTYDHDVLALGKPYGVHCVTPRQFLGVVLRPT